MELLNHSIVQLKHNTVRELEIINFFKKGTNKMFSIQSKNKQLFSRILSYEIKIYIPLTYTHIHNLRNERQSLTYTVFFKLQMIHVHKTTPLPLYPHLLW